MGRVWSVTISVRCFGCTLSQMRNPCADVRSQTAACACIWLSCARQLCCVSLSISTSSHPTCAHLCSPLAECTRVGCHWRTCLCSWRWLTRAAHGQVCRDNCGLCIPVCLFGVSSMHPYVHTVSQTARHVNTHIHTVLTTAYLAPMGNSPQGLLVTTRGPQIV